MFTISTTDKIKLFLAKPGLRLFYLTEIVCENVVELSEIERIFSTHFPFPNMGKTGKTIKCFNLIDYVYTLEGDNVIIGDLNLPDTNWETGKVGGGDRNKNLKIFVQLVTTY